LCFTLTASPLLRPLPVSSPSSYIDPILKKVFFFFFYLLHLFRFPVFFFDLFSDPNIFGLQFSAAKDEFIEDVTSVVSGKEKKKKKKIFLFFLWYMYF
jgi:hypothetical protein